MAIRAVWKGKGLETAEKNQLRINEIYLSVQGESSWAGMPCVFVRLTGCSLRCVWCDTAYAFHEGEDLPLAAILEKVKSYGVRLVEITGGEPLEQEGVYALMESLVALGYEVLLETSGAVDVGRVPPEVVKIMDVKCPGSGEEKRNHWENLGKLVQWQDEIKFVLRDQVDYDYAKDLIGQYGLAKKFIVLFSPSHGELDPAQLCEWINRDKLPVRLNLQLHKYIWPKDTKGR